MDCWADNERVNEKGRNNEQEKYNLNRYVLVFNVYFDPIRFISVLIRNCICPLVVYSKEMNNVHDPRRKDQSKHVGMYFMTITVGQTAGSINTSVIYSESNRSCPNSQ